MSATKKIYAVPGRRVRVPGTHAVVPAAGIEVTWSAIWERRRRAGDISLTPPEPADGSTDTAAASPAGKTRTKTAPAAAEETSE